MIARVWRVWTANADAAAYAGHLERTAIRDLAAAPGNHGVLVLSRSREELTEFVVVSLWRSLDAARAFCGDGIALPDDGSLIEREPAAADYEFYARGDIALGASIFLDP